MVYATQQSIDKALDRIIRIAKENMKKEVDSSKLNKNQICQQANVGKKKTIPSTVKRLVWHRYIGEEKGKSKCMCCDTTEITQLSFHCGHVIPEAHGGEIVVENLRPICQNCNSSMGTMNMNDFMKMYKI
jgi:hypothetical protein